MHTVELLDQAIRTAQALGYALREEWLGGEGGGDCEIKGQKWLFLDLGQPHDEQLGQVLDLLRREDAANRLELPPDLKALVAPRKSA